MPTLRPGGCQSRLAIGTGLVQRRVRNAAATRFQYADPDRLNPRFSPGRLYYAKVRLDW